MPPPAFRARGFPAAPHRALDALAASLARATAGDATMPVLPPVDPHAALASWPDGFPAEPAPPGALAALVEQIIARSNHLHHPRYVGHQVTSPLPSTAILDCVAALLNNGAAVFEMGPVAIPMERHLIKWMAAQLGLPATTDGIFTSGGSVGNLTALLAARQAKAGWDVWTEGASGGPPLAMLVSEQTHYSASRALQIMGMGKRGVIPVAVDARFRLRPDALPDAFAAAERAGRRVIGVIGSACSTATGAFDPLDAIADFCAARDLWFHVDAAHGASAALSPKYRDLLRGLDRADPVVWDTQHVMLLPALVTAVLFRDGARSYGAFAQDASYLFTGTHPDGDSTEQAEPKVTAEREVTQWWNPGLRTLECTKRMLAIQLYGALTVHGTRLFADYVEATFDLAKRFAARIQSTPDFELAVEPQCNIVCFRYGRDDATQTKIRRALLDDGSFYLVQTTLPQGVFLRVTLINPFTTDADLAALIDRISGS